MPKIQFLLFVLLCAILINNVNGFATLHCAVRTTPNDEFLNYSPEACQLTSRDIACVCPGADTKCEYTVRKHHICVDNKDPTITYLPSQYSSQCQHTLASTPTIFKCTPPTPKSPEKAIITISNIDILSANKTVSLISDGQDPNLHLTVGLTAFWVVFDYYTNNGVLNNVFDIYINSAVSSQWGSPIYSTTAGVSGRKEIFFSSLSTNYDFSFVSKVFRRDFIDVNIGILVRTYDMPMGQARDGMFLTRGNSNDIYVRPICTTIPTLRLTMGVCTNSYDTVPTCNSQFHALQNAYPTFFTSQDDVMRCQCPSQFINADGVCVMSPSCGTTTCLNGAVATFDATGSCSGGCSCDPLAHWGEQNCEKCDLICGDTSQTSFYNSTVRNLSSLNDKCECQCSIGFTGSSCQCHELKTLIQFDDLLDPGNTTLIKARLPQALANLLNIPESNFEIELVDTTSLNFTIAEDVSPYSIAIVKIAACLDDLDAIETARTKKSKFEYKVGSYSIGDKDNSAFFNRFQNDFTPAFIEATIRALLIDYSEGVATLNGAIGGDDLDNEVVPIYAVSMVCKSFSCDDVKIRGREGTNTDSSISGTKSGLSITYPLITIIIVVALSGLALLFIIIIVITNSRSSKALIHHRANKSSVVDDISDSSKQHVVVIESVVQQQPVLTMQTQQKEQPTNNQNQVDTHTATADNIMVISSLDEDSGEDVLSSVAERDQPIVEDYPE